MRSALHSRRWLAPWLLLTLAVACEEGPAAPAPAPRILSATLTDVPAPLARDLEVVLDDPGRVEVIWRASDAPPLRVVTADAAERHTLTLARLYADRIYTVEVLPLGSGDESGEPWVGEFRTAPLPPSLDALTFRAEGTPTHPLAMLELTRSDGFLGFVAVDARGRVVWFHPTVGGAAGGIQRANGRFALIDEGRGLLSVAPNGRVLATVPQDSANRMIHHDVIEPAPGSLLFIAQDWRDVRGTRIAGEAIWEWSPEMGGAPQKRWTAWDHLHPDIDWGAVSVAHDWLHANAISLGPRRNVVMSFHYLNQVVSIAPGFGPFEWRLGGGNATLQVDDDARFTGQHTAAEIAPNRVLMFDNGFERTTERYSRAMEFELDRSEGKATKVWEWRPSPDVWARIVGLARRFPNGNTLVAFGTESGFVGSTGPVSAQEIDPAGRTVWRITVDGVPLMYRAWPLDHIAGEAPLP